MAYHAGFDILQYPDNAMDWLKANTNLVWCGYYLAPAPNRPTSTWMGAFGALNGQWGLLPIYVGQQDARTARPGYTPKSNLSSAQGATDGTDACNLAASEGFPGGSFVFLDWEYGGNLDAEGTTDYITAWVSTVAADARAQPGIYCSHNVAAAIAALVDTINPTPATRFFCWKVPPGQDVPHPFTGDISSLPEVDPAGCGFAGAQMWQREQNAIVTFPAGAPVPSLTMDFSSSALANPGSSAVTQADMAALARHRAAQRRAATQRKRKTSGKRRRPARGHGAPVKAPSKRARGTRTARNDKAKKRKAVVKPKAKKRAARRPAGARRTARKPR